MPATRNPLRNRIQDSCLSYADDPTYTIHHVDSSGRILNTTDLRTGITMALDGANVRELFDIKTLARFLWAMNRALRTSTPVGISYRVQGVKFSALFEPLNDKLTRIHEFETVHRKTAGIIIEIKRQIEKRIQDTTLINERQR